MTTVIFLFALLFSQMPHHINLENTCSQRSFVEDQAFAARPLLQLNAPATQLAKVIAELPAAPETYFEKLVREFTTESDIVRTLSHMSIGWVHPEHTQETIARAIFEYWNTVSFPSSVEKITELLLHTGKDLPIYLNVLTQLGLRIEDLSPLIPPQDLMHVSVTTQLFELLGSQQIAPVIQQLQQLHYFPAPRVQSPYPYVLLEWMAQQIATNIEAVENINYVLTELSDAYPRLPKAEARDIMSYLVQLMNSVTPQSGAPLSITMPSFTFAVVTATRLTTVAAPNVRTTASAA